MSPSITESRTFAIIDKPIEEIWAFVTVPANWVRLGLGTWKVHGGKGEDDTEPTSRPMKVGEHFIEYMRMPGRFDFVGDWVVTKSEAPHTWGFKSVKWLGPPLPTDIEATYTLEKIDENTTKWSRHRVNTMSRAKSSEVDFLEGSNDLEEEYQRVSKSFIETGKTGQDPYNPTEPHPPGWVDALQVTECYTS